MSRVYRVIADDYDMTDADDNDVAFTTEAAARKWAMKKLDEQGAFVIYDMEVDPKS